MNNAPDRKAAESAVDTRNSNTSPLYPASGKQPARLLAQMLTGQKVTPLSAWRSLGIYRLSDTVLQLRKLGWSIESGYETRPNKFGEGCRFAAYRLNNDSIENSGMEGVAFTEREIAAMHKRRAS